MAQNYDLNNTGPEVQARLDQVFPNRDAISEETGQREQGDVDLSSALEAEINRAQGAESELQSQVNDTYRKSETYTKEEVNGLITTPDQQFVSVVATAQTEEAEDVLPDVGAPNTIYRVGNWDGAAYDTSCYSEYAWDGSGYVLLSVKSVGIDDVPTAGSENLVKSGGVAKKTDKIIYRSIFQSTATGGLIPRIDTVIKELYISAADLGDNDASKYCVQNIRRNVRGTWYVDFYYYDNGTGTQALRFNSVKKTGELEAIRTSNESYCVIDWSLLADGESIYIAPRDVGAYLLDGAYVSDVDNFPISKSAGFQRSAGGNISRLNLSVTTLQETVDEVGKSVFPVATTVGRFVKEDGTFGTAAAAQRLRWCMSGLIPLDYFKSENSVLYGSTDNIVLKNCYHREGSSAPYCLFYDESETPLTGEGAYITAPGESKADITLVWGESGNIPDTAKYVRINFYQDGYIENLLPEGGGGGGESESVDDAFIAKFNKFAVSWIDDDFKITEVSGAITENYPVKVKDMCDEMGCKCDFAVIPSSDKSWGGDNYPTDDHQFIPDYKIDIIKSWQHEGFHFQLHPIHKGWYSGGSQGYVYQGVAFCEQSLVKCMEAFNAAGVIYDQCIVYPGASGANVGVIDMVRRWLEFGFSATTSDKYNSGIVDSLRLRRLFLNFGSEDVAFYKAQIDAAVAAGAWVVIGTHSAQAVDDLDNPTSDTSALTLSNIKEVVQYANSKSTIRPIREVWNKRKMMLGLYSG